MDSEALGFRESCVNNLRFMASHDEQRDFAARVHYDDYEGEFSCWWFDDLVFDSLPHGTDLIRRSFSSIELIALAKFTAIFEGLDHSLGNVDRTIDELLDNPDWLKVVEAAAEVLDSVPTFAT
jgi:hypothetical protein